VIVRQDAEPQPTCNPGISATYLDN
jgi:hypothetical protein